MTDIKHSSSPSQSGVPDNPLEPDEDKIREVLGYNGDLPESQEDNFLRSSDANLEPIDPAEARRVLWTIDLLIIPLISGTIILSAVDKVIISNAAIYGMMTDTRLSSSMFSWVASIFYFGYLLFEYPSALLIQHLPVAKLLAFTVFLWAFLMGCTAATQNFAGLIAVRFIMGMSEATCNPIASIVTVMWYTKSEQPVRVAFWYNQLSSVFSGLVSYGIGHANSAIAPWRLLSIALAAFSALWAILIWVFLPDSPVKCWWLSDREKYIAIRRIRANNTGIEDRTLKWYQLKECLSDPKTWLLAIFVCAQNIPNGCLVTFSALIVSGLNYSRLLTTVLGIPTGVIATIWQLVLSLPTSRLKNQRCIIIALGSIIPIISAILLWQIPDENRHGRLAAYYVFYTYWGPYVMSTTLPMANTSGHTKKVTMNAVFFLAYCLGNIIGPQVFQASDAPTYPNGYIGLLASLIVASVSICLYGILCSLENIRGGKERGIEELPEVTDPFSDLTDNQKASFRYTY